MNDKLPPQNIEAEESILGGIMLDSEAIPRVRDILDAEAFYVLSHREIYRSALQLYLSGKPTDLMSVTNWLRDRNLLTSIGGRNKLVSLVEGTVSAINIDSLAKLVMDKHTRRKIISAGREIAQLGYETQTELQVVVNDCERKLFQVTNQILDSKTEHNSTIAAAAYQELQASNPIYMTGLKELDQLLVGFEGGTMTILAGRPSMGKSFIASFLALQMILLHKLPVIIFSLEMTKKQLEYRLWSFISASSAYREFSFFPMTCDRIRRHRSTEKPLEEWELKCIASLSEVVSDLPLYINDYRGIDVLGIASECRQIQSCMGKIGLVVVDYLQMMAVDADGNRSYELGNVARELYKLAGDLNVPILALSQISRSVEARPNKRPMMSDLSQSGVLEMVADNIILAYRDEYYNSNSFNRGVLELIVAKARHGNTGTAAVWFDRNYGTITDMKSKN
ncbi:replicative DNA helicase [Brunnivagina elsteri]|uniref:Replicative DNA helicase n=1 Tax=Brunnivagina elsteri CCALA 953 TaxID=987040 RepID=A0A2A2TKY1_9CYAN|nr:replicative DNA helicase [Calothrix elsteri]PAX57118.1 replicative DNA helicase [Calothrix elsteri CCALA 953]